MVSLSLRRFPLLAVPRPLYSGVLATVLWMATHDNPNNKQDIIRYIFIVSFGILVIFYSIFVGAGLIRETVVEKRRGYYQEQRIAYYKINKWKERLHVIWQSPFIQNSMSLQGLAALLVIISYMVFVLKVGVRAILPGAH
jgi:hypothetical protein